MTELERRLERRLRKHADIPVTRADSMAIARDVMATPRRTGFGPWFASLRGPMRLAIVAALVAAAVAGILAAGSVLRVAPIVDASFFPLATTPEATPASSGLALQDGVWLADRPADMTFGASPIPARLALAFDANVNSMFITASNSDVRLFNDFVEQAVGTIAIESRGPSSPVTSGAAELPGCTAGDRATYQYRRSSDGLHLRLSVVSDPCAARSAVLERTWVRSLGGVNTGGLGVIATVGQLFSVELPSGTFSAEHHPGSIIIVQAIPELQLMVVEDPDGYLDPCNPSGGRAEIAPTADAFVEYFRQLPGFTVDSTSEVVVDGRRGIHLATHADVDATCPSGQLYEWRAGVDSSDFGWFLRPGDPDSLYIVEVGEGTMLFELLPPPHPQESEVMASIRFLDELPPLP